MAGSAVWGGAGINSLERQASSPAGVMWPMSSALKTGTAASRSTIGRGFLTGVEIF